jgi:hypothetical protein
MYSSDYFIEQITKPGGLAVYLGGFITQFFYQSSLGAIIIASLLVIQGWLLKESSSYITEKNTYWLLTYTPSLLIAIVLCDENIMYSLLIAFSCFTLAIYAYCKIGKTSFRFAYLLLMTPFVYWLIGMAVLVFTLSCILIEWARSENKTKTCPLIITSILSMVLLILCPFIGKMIWVQYPLKRLFFAGDYFRFAMYTPSFIIYALVSPVLILALMKWLPDVKKKTSLFFQVVQLGILVIIGWWGMTTKTDWTLEEFMGYDYYVRTEKWNNIIHYANQKAPESPLAVTALNLALSQKGYLSDYMFNYFQNGPEGLLPNYSIDFIASALLGEVYYHIGQINTAQRYTFEAMETIPDHQKSVRCIKRLAETSLINGQYEVAVKYLNMLCRTHYYNSWAVDAMAYLRNEEKINNHPEWGKLRKFRLQSDTLFYEENKEQVLLDLFTHNKENKMAMDYLLAYYLLTKNMQGFLDCYGVVEEAGLLTSMPKSYQEALTLIWSNVSGKEDPPAELNINMIQRLNSFMGILQNGTVSEHRLRQEFGDTYWYYFHFRHNVGNTQTPLINPSIY